MLNSQFDLILPILQLREGERAAEVLAASAFFKKNV